MAYIVYCHTFPNGKRYIGITCQDTKRRWRNKGAGYIGQPVYLAILKYGWENIKHEILYNNLTQSEAVELEKKLIKELKTNSHKNGYNIEEGGSSYPLSEQTKAKLRESKIEYYKHHKHWNSGKHLSEETKAKISKARQGKKASEETKAKLSKLNKGSNNRMYGTKIPVEHKIKLQEACVKACSKKIICIETGKIYQSSCEAERQTGIYAGTIRAVCNKNPKYHKAGGYHWRYVEEVENG